MSPSLCSELEDVAGAEPGSGRAHAAVSKLTISARSTPAMTGPLQIRFNDSVPIGEATTAAVYGFPTEAGN
jgi:hypothetical protein